MATRRLSGMTTSASVPDNGGDHSGGGGSGGGYVDGVFSTYLYEGTGASQTIVNGIDLAGEGGMVWQKKRSGGQDHYLHDTEQGTNKRILPNSTSAQQTLGTDSFNENGFTFQSDYGYNDPGADFVTWTFRKAPKFFDVVTWTGDGVAGREIPHNLGVEPGMIIVKNITLGGADWRVYHRSLGATKNLLLNGTNAALTQTGMWNDTEPTSTVFTVGDDGGTNGNAAAYDYVAYVFAHDDSDESMIKCGSFTGNPTTIDLGFEPQWMIAKKYDSTSSWQMFDAMRGWTADGGTVDLVADTDSSESDRLSRDYTQLKSDGVTFNGYGGSWIYMAIRRPNKPAEEFEPDELFAIDAGVTNREPCFVSGFPVGMAIHRDPVADMPIYIGGRLTQGEHLKTNNTDAAVSSGTAFYDYQDGWRTPTQTAQLSWMWRRAPGFFDVVAYEGNGQATHEIPHSLGTQPEMIWIKSRSEAYPWPVYHKDTHTTNTAQNWRLDLSTDGGRNGGSSYFPFATLPDSFPVGSANHVNKAGAKYIAYLFASVPGICDIGSYTGNGGDLDIDCGFTSGARFVLIKRTDSNGDWMHFDTERGISSTDSPMLKLNETDAQVSGSYIKPHSNGFTATSNLVGIVGAEYIYMAIA